MVPRSCFPITHLSFTDDVLNFFKDSKQALQATKKILEDYLCVSSELVNMQKSSFIILEKASHTQIAYVAISLGLLRHE
jgi:hypothetical protein